MKLNVLLLFAILSNIFFTNAQPPKKFGQVNPEDFNVKSSLIDSSTSAVILFNVGNCSFEGNTNGWFSIKYTRHARIKIFKKNGYDAAVIKELLYIGDHNREETMDDIKASTFNLVNNEVVETKLNKADIITSKYVRNYNRKVFTLPALKEESIIEFTYTIHSEYTRYLRSWKFENEYPCLYNEYAVAIPDIFNYVCDLRENVPLKASHSDYFDSFIISDDEGTASSSRQTFTARTSIRQTKWIAVNIPSVKDEPFLRTIDNFISKVDFQLKEIRIPNQPIDYRYNSWDKVCEDLRKSEYFGEQIYAGHHWLNEPLKALIGNTTDTLAIIKKVYEYVRDNFSKTKEEGIYLSQNTSLKDIFNNKKGSTAELNMLLVAMLRKLNINAEPTILSTRSNGIAHPFYPILSEYNYLIACAIVGDSKYFMDASEPFLGFDKLTLECYNGYSRILTPTTIPYSFNSSRLNEKESVSMMVVSDEKGMKATVNENLGYYSSLDFRDEFAKKKKDEIIEKYKKEFNFETTISNFNVDSLNDYNNCIKLSYDANFSFKDDIIYFNPLLNYAIKENPFKADNRKFPIEKPYVSSLNYYLTLMIPQGYKLDEKPKSVRAKLNEEEGLFEYIINADEEMVQLRCKLNFEKSEYAANDYQSIRDFYSIVVKKMNEEIVFKKITK